MFSAVRRKNGLIRHIFNLLWQGYDKQLTKALARVTIRDAQSGDITNY